MPTSANARVEAADAPGGLALVQELLNTAAGGDGGRTRPDLLSDVAAARDWAAGRVGPALADAVDEAGAARLRSLRHQVRGALHAPGTAERPPEGAGEQVGLVLRASGEVGVEPGSGAAGIAGLVLAEVLLAQQRGDWARLKVCALPVCGAVFYDRSRNASGRYHAAWCANFVNLRASRARRREA